MAKCPMMGREREREKEGEREGEKEKERKRREMRMNGIMPNSDCGFKKLGTQ